MGRTQRALTSLVAAIPAGFLSYLLVMVFLNQADSLNTTMQAVVGATLLASIMVTVMPFVLLIPGKKKATADAAAGTSDEEDAVEVMDDDDAEVSGVLDEDVEEEAVSATSDFDLADSDADVMSDSSGEIDSGNASSLDNIDAFDMDDEDDDPKPKKRKK